MSIEDFFQIAITRRASDLHLVVGLKPFLRVDGKLISFGEEIISEKVMENMIFSVLSAPQKDRLLKERALDISMEINKNNRFRVNVYYEKGNLSLAARVILSIIPTLEEVTMPKVILSLLKLKQGLILITGPTGCGKSTSLASMIDYVNQEERRNIITLEDPIEFIFKPKKSIVIQRQLGTDMLSFADGLKHTVRQDPDVIMVGEMRDLETISAAVTLAETGHLVLATLHTYSAAQTVDRIIDIFPPFQQSQIKMQLSTVLAAVISQRLISKINGGRVAAREILINTPAVANLIRESKISQLKTVIQTSAREGMISMEKALKNLNREGLISKEELGEYIQDPWMN